MLLLLVALAYTKGKGDGRAEIEKKLEPPTIETEASIGTLIAPIVTELEEMLQI